MTAEPLWVPLDGAMNVRDLGGLPTDDGGETVRGRVLRADNLQDLTPADVRRLVDDLRVRTIVDLRTTIEVDKEGPGPLTREARVEHRHLSLYPESGGLTDVDEDGEKVLPWQTDWGRAAGDDPAALNPAIGYYLAYLRHRPDSVLAALRAMASADGAVVVHCAAGKDRTGVVVALALSAAGVRRAAVVADYVATGDRIDAVVDRLLASPTYAADLERGDAHRPRAVTMEGFLEVLDERFGGPVGWLASAGFGPGEVAALRHRLVG